MANSDGDGQRRTRLLDDLPMDVYSVRLTPYHARMARLIGSGNMTEGIRTSIELASKAHKDRKPKEST
jgi:hypothetical protein